MNTSSQNDSVQDIRGVLIQVGGARLLLPNATISEVLSYADPEPVENAPEWLLGRIRWRGWQLPLVSFSRIAGLAEEQRSEEHTSELQSLMRISYAVFCLKKKNTSISV